MEDLFYRNLDQELLDQMKADMAADEDRSCLMAATGIQNAEIINQLMDHGITMESMAGIGLIPLIAVAWADGKMEDREREAILKAAAESGIDQDHACYALIGEWLKNPPAETLLESWKAYVSALKDGTLGAEALGQVRTSVVQRAKNVANSAGGFLGLSKTSASEQKVIDELDSAFA